MAPFKKLIEAFRGKAVLVIGDLILDQHIRGSVSRISPEAPVPVVLQEGKPSFAPGGAANVAHNLRALGAQVTMLGRIGPDAEGRDLLRELRKLRISTKGVFVDTSTCTILKTRIMARHQQVLRLDREEPVPADRDKLLRRVRSFLGKELAGYDAVIISDYGKGMVFRELLEEVCARCAAAGTIVTVDPKVEHFAYYKGVTAITPNRQEAENAIRNIKVTESGRRKLALNSDRLQTIGEVERAGQQLVRYLRLDSLLITLGEQGMCLFEKGKKPFHIHTLARDVFDVTGAGDTVIAVYTLGLVAGASRRQAADLANCAAGIVVARIGPVAVTRAELLEAARHHG